LAQERDPNMHRTVTKPEARPRNPCFSSGPCTKRPGWSLAALGNAAVGRSHRSRLGKARLGEVIERSKGLLGVPADHRLGIVPASDTGAVEMALWSLLEPRGVDVLAWEHFGHTWVADITRELRLADVRVLAADYGLLPDLSEVDFRRDVVFTWNGTTSGVCVPDGDWIAADRAGLTICDATSAAFAVALPWDKLDVVTYSWQKVLGGEAQHGVLILGPRAVERLMSHKPSWPMPKIFRLLKNGGLNEGLFRGETINTPSMLAVEDALDALKWAESIGGLPELVRRAQRNSAAVAAWVERTGWADFLARDPKTRSPTSFCIKVADPWFQGLPAAAQREIVKRVTALLEQERAAFDIGSYVAAPPGFRVWTGATVETADIEAMLPWLDYAYYAVTAETGRA
jgi:phosphoserine aminotransferase